MLNWLIANYTILNLDGFCEWGKWHGIFMQHMILVIKTKVEQLRRKRKRRNLG